MKILTAETDLTSATNISKVPVVRIYNSDSSAITLTRKSNAGETIGSYSVPSGKVIYWEKSYTDTLEGGAALKATGVGYSEELDIICLGNGGGSSIVETNLVLHLNANNYSGSGAWLDETTNNHDGTINGATYVAASGSDSAYFDFDGTNDYAKIDDSSDFLMGTGSFTEEAWHKRDGNTTWENPISRRVESSWGGLWINGSGNFFPYHYTEPSGQLTFNTGEAAGTEWIHHVTTTTNTGSAVTIKVYTNGSLRATQSTTVSGWQPRGTSVGDSDIYIGGIFGESYWYDGKIAICRLYKGKALTASEVTQNWNAQKSLFGY